MVSSSCHLSPKVCWEQQLRSGGPSPARPTPSAGCLSPFLRKKAQILEVLRALEETDPLLLCSPATPGSLRRVLAPRGPSMASSVAHLSLNPLPGPPTCY